MDTRTLLVCLFALLCLFSGAFFLMRRRQRGAGLGWLAASFASSAAGFALVALRGGIPDLWSIVAGNALIMSGYLLLHQAVTSFLGLGRRHLRPGLALLAALVAGLAFLTYGVDDTRRRIVLLSLAVAVQGGLSAALLLRAAGAPAVRLAMRFVGGVLATFAGLNLARALLTLAAPATPDLMRGDTVQAVSLLAFILAAAAAAIGFAWMTVARLHDTLHAQARHDELTGLLNRRGFLDAARGAAAPKRSGGASSWSLRT